MPESAQAWALASAVNFAWFNNEAGASPLRQKYRSSDVCALTQRDRKKPNPPRHEHLDQSDSIGHVELCVLEQRVQFRRRVHGVGGVRGILCGGASGDEERRYSKREE